MLPVTALEKVKCHKKFPVERLVRSDALNTRQAHTGPGKHTLDDGRWDSCQAQPGSCLCSLRKREVVLPCPVPSSPWHSSPSAIHLWNTTNSSLWQIWYAFPMWLMLLDQEIGLGCSMESQKERASGDAAGGTVAPPDWLWWPCSCLGQGNAPVLGHGTLRARLAQRAWEKAFPLQCRQDRGDFYCNRMMEHHIVALSGFILVAFTFPTTFRTTLWNVQRSISRFRQKE